MSNANQETISDIVREMRTLGRLDGESTDKIPRSLQALGLRTYADRIEAAAKREREATPEKSSVVAYAKKMRDVIHEVQANEKDEIVVHKLAEIAADCAWCERRYGEVDDAHA